MIKTNEIGLFGKLPAHGDFIYRNLPSSFINNWDAWLQGFIANSQQELGEQWLDIYLTSPMWRFACTDGIFDSHHWMGILLPSVDRVGRYFPFSIAARINTQTTPFTLIQQEDWFSNIEDLALAALDGQLRLDDLVIELNKHIPEPNPTTQVQSTITSPANTVFQFNGDTQTPVQSYPYLLDALVRNQSPSYSVWSTASGSERVIPVIALTQGLPGLRHTTALLDGNWQESDWLLISETIHSEHQPAN